MELVTLRLRESISSTNSEDYKPSPTSSFLSEAVKNYCTRTSTRRTACQLFIASLLISAAVSIICTLTIPTITFTHYKLTVDSQSLYSTASSSPNTPPQATNSSSNTTCPRYGPRNVSSCHSSMSWSHFITNNTSPTSIYTNCQIVTSSVLGNMNDICSSFLINWHHCSIGSTNTVYVSKKTAIPDTTRVQISQLLAYKSAASLKCQSVLVPFICQLSFPLCSCPTGDLYLPSRETCLSLSTDICKREWDVVSSLDPTVLPDCQALAPETSFNQSSNNSTNTSTNASASSGNNDTTDSTVCSRNFYKLNSTCLPNCTTFDSDENVLIGQLITAAIAIIGSLMVLIAAVMQWKQVLKFPTIILLYITFACFIFGLVIALSQIDRDLFCTSTNLIESISNPSTFCNISGFIVLYSLLSVFSWSLGLVLFVVYKLMSPVKSEEWIKYDKYIHIFLFISCILYPFITALLPTLVSEWEYTMITFPPTHCTTKSIDYFFYTVILPICITLGLTVCLGLVLVWKRFHRWINSIQLFNTQSNDTKFHFLFYCYIALLETILLLQTVLYTTSDTSYTERAMEYFVCELFGHDNTTTSECQPLDNRNYTYPLIFYYILLSLLPLLIVIGLINYGRKNCLSIVLHRRGTITSHRGSM